MTFYISALILGLCLSSMGLGIFITMKIFKIPDITTDGSYTLGAVCTAVLLTEGVPLYLTFFTAIISGALAGIVTGLINTKLKIDALLSGILVMTGLYSVNLTIMGRSNIPLIDVSNVFGMFPFPMEDTYRELFVCLFFIGILSLLVAYILRTDLGIAMRATGNSESMTRALGINNNQMKIIGLSIANALTAISGFLVAQFQRFTDINMGIGIVLIGLGAVLIGDALVKWININHILGKLGFVILGSIIFQLVLAFALSLGIDPSLLKLITATSVMIIVAIPLIFGRKES